MKNKRIDIGECEYINGFCYKTGMLCKDVAFCNIRRIQQLKEENEKLCTVIRNELPEQYDKRVSEAESDIAWGVLDRNATESEFCKNVIYETRNYIAKLKQENEGLKSLNDFNVQKIETLETENEKLKSDLQEETKLGHKAMCDEADMAWEVTKLQKVLDEIEGIVEQYGNNGIELSVEKQEQILQLIKQAKEGGE